jgi:hypothetical protein
MRVPVISMAVVLHRFPHQDLIEWYVQSQRCNSRYCGGRIAANGYMTKIEAEGTEVGSSVVYVSAWALMKSGS